MGMAGCVGAVIGPRNAPAMGRSMASLHAAPLALSYIGSCMPDAHFVCSVFKSKVVCILVVCLFSCPSTFAGKLEDFEKDATKKQERSAGQNSGRGSHADRSDRGSLFDFLDFSAAVGTIITEGGMNSWDRVASEAAITARPRKEGSPPLERRQLGEALIPFVRLDTSYQHVESDIHALDARLELGYGPFAVSARNTHYKEDDPDDRLDVREIHLLYRMSFGNSVEVDLGVGQLTIDGKGKNSDISFSLPILFHPKEWLGIEFRPAWAHINENAIQDYDVSLL